MAATQGQIGYGSLLQYGDGGSPETFTTVAEISGDIEGPSVSRTLVDATHMESPDGYKEWLAGMKDGGTVEFECTLLPSNASQTSLLTLFENGTARNWRIQLPQFTPSATLTFTAVVQDTNFSFPREDKQMFTVALKVTGKPVWS